MTHTGVPHTGVPHTDPGSRKLDEAEVSRVIEMAWQDCTPFEAIRTQFGLNEAAVKKLMQQRLKPGSYRLWRERVQGRHAKHGALHAALERDRHG